MLEKLNKFYIYADEGLFVDSVTQKEEYKLNYSKYVTNLESNYVIDIITDKDFYVIEDDVKKDMQKLDRKPCYIITPLSVFYKDRNKIFDKNKYDEINEAWLIYDDFEHINKIDSKCTLNVTLEMTNDMKKFAEITYKAFSTNDPLDPYGEMEEGYIEMYENYDKSCETKYTREFYLVKVDDKIVGTILAVFDEEIFGIYGFAIIKEYRGKGIGTEVIKQLLNICKDKNKKVAFLQTEEGFYPAALYRKIGFKDVCNVFYYKEK